MTGGGLNAMVVMDMYPSNYLVDTLPESNEQWENEEYFDSYSHLVSRDNNLWNFQILFFYTYRNFIITIYNLSIIFNPKQSNSMNPFNLFMIMWKCYK